MQLLNIAKVAVVAALLGPVVAVPQRMPNCDSQTVCIEGVNECGIEWGGCFDTCYPDERPTKPACMAGDVKTVVPTSSVRCVKQIECLEGVDDCGNPWGGCYDVCQPSRRPTKPACKVTSMPTSALAGCQPGIVCVAGINDCGNEYSGCYDTCSPQLSPTAPPCSSALPTITAAPTFLSSVDDCKSRTVCITAVNACGVTYGACVPDCKPWSFPSTPPCTKIIKTELSIITLAPSPTSSTLADDCRTRTLCVEYMNECGMMYGQCHDDCSPRPPMPSKPTCPVNATIMSMTTVTRAFD